MGGILRAYSPFFTKQRLSVQPVSIRRGLMKSFYHIVKKMSTVLQLFFCLLLTMFSYNHIKLFTNKKICAKIKLPNKPNMQLFKRGFFNQHGGTYVFEALLKPLSISTVVAGVTTVKNNILRCLP